ncbi:MAG: tetratricopeptide repeat protein [Actinobacteria bacterium]|nr:tetratricopeptide repeat protein [Actinomycetota bacterium]
MNFRIIFKILALSLIIALLFSIVTLGSACKKKTRTGIAEGNEMQESSISDNGSTTETDSGTSGSDGSQTSGSTVANSGSADKTSSQSVSETETTNEIIPQEITDLITKADAYYASGEYALASKTYRNAQQAIKNSDLSEEARQMELNLFANKYKKAKEITDTARMHYGNAMSLEYQQRYEEAKEELEAALAIYPKYKDAIDAYETLKALMGLE